MFKKNYEYVLRDVYFENFKEVIYGNKNYFFIYGNGKFVVRI